MIKSINLLTGFKVKCDECGVEEYGELKHYYYKDTVKSVAKYLREREWSIGEKNLCPKCRKRKPKSETKEIEWSMDTYKFIEAKQNELKKCPFCGGKAKIVVPKASFMLKKWHNRTVIVVCTRCECATRLFDLGNRTGSPLINQAHEKEAVQKAVNAWNERDNETLEYADSDKTNGAMASAT